MRVYTYIPKKALIVTGVKGLYPHVPHGDVYKVLEKYVQEKPIEVEIRGVGTVRLSTKAIYGALTTDAMPLANQASVDKYGILAFFNLARKYNYPVFLADYRYKMKILELILLKENHEDVVSGKFKSVGEAIKYYAGAYWKSVKPIKTAITMLKREAAESGDQGRDWWKIRKLLENQEVLAYMAIPPEKLFVKAEGKKYIPFLYWLYAHRGLYLHAIKTAKSGVARAKFEQLYSEFMARYMEFNKKLGGKNVEASRGDLYYVFPSESKLY